MKRHILYKLSVQASVRRSGSARRYDRRRYVILDVAEKGLWTEDDQKIKDLDSNIEKLKVQMFENRFKTNARETARLYSRATESN